MTISLYAATVPTFLQSLRATIGWLGKAADFTADNSLVEAEVMASALVPDMFPFNRQVRACAMHSQGAIEGALGGRFSPDMTPAPDSFSGLSARLTSAIVFLEALEPAQIDALADKEMLFELGQTRMKFQASEFLLSFSQPNFFFHTTTAYAILRHLGMPLGKRDYLGQPRTLGE